ncbi:NAD(P)/FAD-dependent oxidoreductase [Actomonas aquatica]|uniref:NAD(P)/FAD-dependent oxidoreductase n=1 Tax=Actomonas aquatica TaxID=2866162 RepID=A0ABZ1C9N9_9BACT|nr:NAD(P)/FAD-dependent oxidoreductase [Opitutus sp. WL0086]WRQ88409.1 NAD(P)/FAD-dependent oxidoreductase [Opitutus sp. WL0086]
MKNVVIVGAGLAGLTCARRLQVEGVTCQIIEASDGVGGRVRTDVVDGFRLDRGFQVLLTAYPEVQRWLDLKALDLQEFWPGAKVWNGSDWATVADPRRRWTDLFRSLSADIGSAGDKLKVVQWALQAAQGDETSHWTQPETTALAALQRRGFSTQMINAFWRPWLSGIFLEDELSTSSRMLEFVFGMFARGGTAVPAKGMGEIPRQLAGGLPEGGITLNERATAVEPGRVWTESRGAWRADHIVLALEPGAAAKLGVEDMPARWNGARCLYFAVEGRQERSPLLMLNGTSKGIVNHAAWMDAIAPDYAPANRSLLMAGIKASVQGDETDIEHAARAELAQWFGEREVAGWKLLRHSWVPQALPMRQQLNRIETGPIAPGIWRCGDACSTASIQGAMESGRRTAEHILRWV